MITIPPELRRAIRDAGDEPIHLLDPETHTVYLLVPVPHHEMGEAKREIEIQREVSLLDPDDQDEPMRLGM